MGAVEKIIMQSVLKSVVDYNNSIEILDPGVKKYFKDHYDDIHCYFHKWHLVDNGNNIKIFYTEHCLNDDMESRTDIIPTETIISIAIDLSLNKRL